MKSNRVDFARILAVSTIILAIVYFYFNIFYPRLIPKSLKIGIIRRPLNILILGTDTNFDAVTLKPMPNAQGRADTILLAHIDPIKWQINVLSIPRDTYTFIPGVGMNKINCANAYGGAALAKQTVSILMQKKIDYYIEIRPSAVTKMVDLLGGVYLFVDKDMYYVDHAQNLNINLKKGWQKLNGKKAHDYIRYRNDIYGDIGRIGRHQIFLKALLQALIRPSNLVKAPFIIKTVLQEIDTDLPLSKTIRILNLSRSFSANNIRTTMVSGEAFYLKDAGAVWLPDSFSIKNTADQLF